MAIYYADGEEFVSHRVLTRGEYIDLAPIVVESGVLKVGNDTYALTGVHGSKLDVDLERPTQNRLKAMRSNRRYIYLCCTIAVLGAVFIHYFSLLLFGAAIYYWYMLMKEQTMDRIEQQLVGRLVLTHNSENTSVVIGCWHPFPDGELNVDLKRLGYDTKRRSERYTEEKRRAETIAQAVGKAIVERAFVGAL